MNPKRPKSRKLVNTEDARTIASTVRGVSADLMGIVFDVELGTGIDHVSLMTLERSHAALDAVITQLKEVHMSDNPPEVKVVFAPGTLEALEAELSPEEIQTLFAELEAFRDEIKRAIRDGDEPNLPGRAVSLEELYNECPEAAAQFIAAVEGEGPTVH